MRVQEQGSPAAGAAPCRDHARSLVSDKLDVKPSPFAPIRHEQRNPALAAPVRHERRVDGIDLDELCRQLGQLIQALRRRRSQVPGTTSGGRAGSGWTRGSAAASARRPMRYQASISPLPLIGIVPLGSQTKSSSSNSFVARVIWIRPEVPCDSIRLAVLTASPQRSYRNRFRPITPATTGPE